MQITLHIDTEDIYLHPPMVAACEEALTFSNEIFDRAVSGLQVAGMPASHIHEWGSIKELCCNQVIVLNCCIRPNTGIGGVDMVMTLYPSGRPPEYPVDPIFGWET